MRIRKTHVKFKDGFALEYYGLSHDSVVVLEADFNADAEIVHRVHLVKVDPDGTYMGGKPLCGRKRDYWNGYSNNMLLVDYNEQYDGKRGGSYPIHIECALCENRQWRTQGMLAA